MGADHVCVVFDSYPEIPITKDCVHTTHLTPQFHGSVLQPDLLTLLLTFLRPEMNFKNISPHGEIVLI